MENKVCSKCGVEKPLTDFYKDKRSKNGYAYTCKTCMKETTKKHYQDNKETLNQRKSVLQKEKRQEYTEYQNLWRSNNKDKVRKSSRKYYENNKTKVLDYLKGYIIKRYEEDILFRLNIILRTSIHRYIYKNGRTPDYLGCSIEDFKKHIENQFQDGMTWENQGRLQDMWGWELDHIIPASSAQTEEELYRLYHFTNFQPLWKKQNLSKGNKLPEEWLNENPSN